MAAERVVLLHGLGRTRMSMIVPRMRLAAAGFDTINVGYPSRTRPIEYLAEHVRDMLESCPAPDDGPVHFLTHSMGGIIVRHLLAGDRSWIRLGRVVMLSPPNRGSKMAGKIAQSAVASTMLGPAGRQLTDGPDGLPGRIGPADYCVGVIAGNRPRSPWAPVLRGESDGTVLVEEARLEGMTDFLVLPRGHTFIMNSLEVIVQAAYFFRHGRFDPTRTS